MKAVGYLKSLPIDDAESLIDFTADKPAPTGRDIRVAVKAVSVNPVDTKVRKRAAAETRRAQDTRLRRRRRGRCRRPGRIAVQAGR